MTDARSLQMNARLPSNDRIYRPSTQHYYNHVAKSTYPSDPMSEKITPTRDYVHATSTSAVPSLQSSSLSSRQIRTSTFTEPPTQIRLHESNPLALHSDSIQDMSILDGFVLYGSGSDALLMSVENFPASPQEFHHLVNDKIMSSTIPNDQSPDTSSSLDGSQSESYLMLAPHGISFSNEVHTFTPLPQPALPLFPSESTSSRISVPVPGVMQMKDAGLNSVGYAGGRCIPATNSHRLGDGHSWFTDGTSMRNPVGGQVGKATSSKSERPRKLHCAQCDESYTGRSAQRNLTRHEQQKHAAGVVILYCGDCGGKYKREDALRKHERAKHPHLQRRDAIPRKKATIPTPVAILKRI
ncbi:hypothetical protein BDV96DRAFT_655655 [Lophiotrema nucula]|uniref:C2H2-type domain-containing protein n=1 Tax=Lophiotrema nucula TaxID=690887 RepID=A0A6A5YF92_9PLEO|nr:hypothetical protein BDV96DRAFT_655655 [Lophiotrema nucula]